LESSAKTILYYNCFIMPRGKYLNVLTDDSLTVSHRFSGARESFLILIDPILGRKASSWSEAFIQLHGILFARLQLDSFDDEIDIFFNMWGQLPATDMQWAMLAVINISALHQYNQKDSLLKDALRQGRREQRETVLDESPPKEEYTEGDTILPPPQLQGGSDVDTANMDCMLSEMYKNISTDIQSDNSDNISLSKIIFEKAYQFSSVFLSETLNSGANEGGPLIAVHIWLIFLTYALRYQPVVRLLEPKLPWQELADFLNDVIALNDDDLTESVPMERPCEPVLAEDSVIRGFEWSKRVLPRDWFEIMDPLEEIEESAESSTSRIKRVMSLGVQLTKVLIYKSYAYIRFATALNWQSQSLIFE
jgi:hypothetical protein